jgi:hypothetical protein
MQIVIRDSAHVVATLDNLVLSVWSGEPTAERLRQAIAISKDLEQTFPEEVAVINLIQANSPPVSSEATQAIREGSKDRTASLYVANVLEHTGFTAAATRAIFATLTLLSSRWKINVVGDPAAAAAWLSKSMSCCPAPERIVKALEELRAVPVDR